MDDGSANASPCNLAKHHDGIALVLQGGGALGAYQAGVYEQLAATGCHPQWIAGVSIGAINAALIAGNPPERRVERLLKFWQLVSSGMGPLAEPSFAPAWLQPLMEVTKLRGHFNQFSALWSAMLGIPGFYTPRLPPAWTQPDGSPGALSIYDTSALRNTLEQLVDFELINSKHKCDCS